MTERLRLEAEFRDRGVAVGLRKISGELKEVRRTPGMNQAKEWMEKFNDRSKEFVTEGGGVGGVLKGIGLGGLLAASSLGELVTSFRELGERTAGLKEVARQTGLTIDQVNELQRAGQRLHIDPGQMTTGLEHLSSQMFDFKRHWGELWGQLNDQGYGAFAQKLSLDKPLEQVQDIVKFLGQIKDPELQKRWTELFFGTGDMSRVLVNVGRDFAAAFKEAQEHAAKITPEMQRQQEEFEKAIQGFDDSWTDFQTTVGPTVFANLSKAADEFKAVFADIKEAYEWVAKAKDHPADAASDAITGFLKDQEKQNEEARAKGKGPWVDIPGALLGSKGVVQGGSPEISNLHKDFQDSKKNINPLFQKSAFTTFDGGGHVEKSAFTTRDGDERDTQHDLAAAFRDALRQEHEAESGGVRSGGVQKAALTGLDAGSTSGSLTFIVAMREAVKSGTLAAFREMMQQREMGDKGDGGGGGGGGGLQNASFETGDGSSGSGGRPHASRGGNGRGGADGGSGPFNAREPEAAGTYRPNYKLSPADVDPRVINTIAGEVSTHNGEGVDAVVNNMMNRVGSKGWGPSANLLQVSQARGQYAGRRHASAGEAAFIRSRIEAVASGGLPDNTHGSNSYRASGYHGPWYQHHRDGAVIGGNRYGYEPGVSNGPYAPYSDSAVARRRQMNLPEAAKSAGAGRMSVEHSGGAEITIKGLPQGTSTQTKTKGLITAVNLQRGPTMISANA